MKYEVEHKFRVSDPSAIERELRAMGAEVSGAAVQVDQYFAHPTRDFAATDEALRIRRDGPRTWVTYKGPKIDPTSKTRREIEVPLPEDSDAADQLEALFGVLDFTPVATVEKRRRQATVRWENRWCHVALDDVKELGFFVELEFSATVDDLAQVQASLQALIHQLGLVQGERRSYLELLLEVGRRPSGPN